MLLGPPKTRMHVLSLMTLIALGAVPVEVRPVAGSSLRGELVDLSADAVVVQSDAGPQRLELANVWELTATQTAAPASRPVTVWVELTDESLIRGDSYTAAAGTATVRTTAGHSLSIRTAAIRAVRFRDYASAPQLAQRWQEISTAKASGDSLVVRRGDNLDQLTGVIRDVTDEAVQFESDGDTVQAKRTKLEGLLYYHPASGELPRRAAQVTDASGSQWSVKSLRKADDQLALVTVAGVAASLPLAQLKRIDFSSGNSQWLDALEPQSVRWRPFIQTKLPTETAARLFQPRGPAARGGHPLLLAGQEYDRGLAVHSRTELVYRLTGDFHQFLAVAGIDDRVRPAGNVRLVISGDDRELFAQTITGADPPLALQVDITGVKRLKILVDFGEQLDIADCLDLCDARITK